MKNMQATMRRQAVRYAVQRAITCPITGQILDVDRAYLVENRGNGAMAILSEKAWQDLLGKLEGAWHETLEVWEGRTGAELQAPEEPVP